jgi:hypothetical protein
LEQDLLPGLTPLFPHLSLLPWMVSSEMSQKMAKEGPRLSKNQKFSEHFSIHCCPPFTFLNSKREIVDRKYSICKSGCFYQKKEEDWICCACQKTR